MSEPPTTTRASEASGRRSDASESVERSSASEPKLLTAASVATAIAGLVTGAGGIAHIVGVTRTALARGGLFDARHTELLLIGWSLVAPASVMLASALAMRRRRAWGFGAALIAGSFLLVEFVLLGSTLGTPQQAVPAYAAALAVLTLVVVAWRREGGAASS